MRRTVCREFWLHQGRVVLLALATSAVFVAEAFARGGGGRNSGKGGILGLILLPFFVAYGWYVNRRIKDKERQTVALLAKLSQNDPRWNEENLRATVRQSFLAAQSAWSSDDLPALEKLLYPTLYAEWKSQLELLRRNGQRNQMDNVTIDDVRIVEVLNYRGDDQDAFIACIDAGAIDYTVDQAGNVVDSNVRDKKKAESKTKEFENFREFWTFRWHQKSWHPAEVNQSGSWRKAVDAPLVNED